MDRGYRVARKVNPKEKAGFFSFLTFAYMLKLFKEGHKRDLEEDDLFRVMTKFRSRNLGDRIQKYYEEEVKKPKPSLARIILKCYGKRYFLMSILILIMRVLAVIIIPKAIKLLVSYFKNESTVTKEEAYIYAAIVIISNVVKVMSDHHILMWKAEYAIEIQVALCSLLYRKSLNLNTSKLSEISPGKIVTLITKDLAIVEHATYIVNEFFIEIIQTVIILWLFLQEVGTSSFVGIGILLLIVPIQLIIGRVIFSKRSGSNKRTDKRLQLTTEILSAIRVVKMYTWENFFAKKVSETRDEEMKKIQSIFLWKSFSFFIGMFFTKLSFYGLIMTYVWLGHSLSGETVYYLASFYEKLRRTVTFLIPFGIFCTAETIASLKRTSLVLFAEEAPMIDRKSTAAINPKIVFRDASSKIAGATVLNNITVTLTSGLNIIVGPVGSGKSSLLKAILEEYALSDGKMNVEGRVSYASQHPWLFPSSIKQNIIFGQSYNVLKYNEVIEVCSLAQDIEGFSNGDETILSDCGVNLSKGQQCRVNLARAIYRDSDIYLLDDCLSSIDQRVKKAIFQNCIKQYLKDSLCVLVTHDTHLINEADNVIVMSKGEITYAGKPSDVPDDLLQTIEILEDDIETLDSEDTTSSVDKNEIQADVEEASKLLQETYTSEKANIYHEVKKIGKVEWKVYNKYFKFGGGLIMFATVVALYLGAESIANYGDKLVSQWVNIEENITSYERIQSSIQNYQNILANLTHYIESNGTDSVEFQDVLNYASNETSIFKNESIRTDYDALLFDLRNILSNETVDHDIPSWYNLTDNITSKYANASYMEYAAWLDYRSTTRNLYSISIVVTSLLIFARSCGLFVFSVRVSKRIHKAMVFNVFGSTMHFFDRNMIGNIINRFSKDLSSIDEFIPHVIGDTLRSFGILIATVGLIATINVAFSVFSLILLVVFLVICVYYMPTSRSLKRLDGSCRSPMVGHLNATLEGLITIRAFATQRILSEEFDKHQDLSTSANHVLVVCGRTLGFFLSMISSVFVSVIILYSLIFDSDSQVGNVGLAVTQSFLLCNFLEWGVRQWVQLENQMTCVERILEYTDVPQENKTGRTIENWPSKGAIEFKNVSLTYRENNEQVLKNLNFVIKPEEKIGIVGRTGAGKSSIIVTLFRLYDVDGQILIDDVNIKSLSLEFLRTHIAIIPQDPVLFSGTVRSNVDPTDEYSDEEIWHALDSVNLKQYIKSLDVDIKNSGISFSVGQRQLVCLARAIIRKTKIIILDEATANMDEETDAFVQNKIKELFSKYTVITVAHRLHTIMDYDKVMVMDRGELIEFDSPRILLEDKSSLFYKMVNHIH